jgi:hypothetical protein
MSSTPKLLLEPVPVLLTPPILVLVLMLVLVPILASQLGRKERFISCASLTHFWISPDSATALKRW